jgi:hypothetical protein
MNPTDPLFDLGESDIGRSNLERLLQRAYRPEQPDPDFVWRLKDRLCETAQELTQARAQEVWSPITGEAGKQALAIARGAGPALSPREYRLRRLRRTLGWSMSAAAAVAAVALFLYAWYDRPLDPTPDRPAERQVQRDGIQIELLPPRTGARARVGEALATQTGQRRRVQLPDGSVLYVNQNSRVEIDAPRRLTLTAGEIFVMVAQRDLGDGASFVVHTADRRVTALGTHFAVRVADTGTAVCVLQGTVHVIDTWGPRPAESLLYSGQQLAPGSDTVIPLPRASDLLDWTRELDGRS